MDDVDWMLVRIGDLEAAAGIVCSKGGLRSPRVPSNVAEVMPESEEGPASIRQMQDKIGILAERVSRVALLLGVAESEEGSEDEYDGADQH